MHEHAEIITSFLIVWVTNAPIIDTSQSINAIKLSEIRFVLEYDISIS